MLYRVCEVLSYTLSHLNVIKIPKDEHYYVPYLIDDKTDINEMTLPLAASRYRSQDWNPVFLF